MTINNLIRSQFEESQKVLEEFISDEGQIQKISEAAKIIVGALQSDNKIISCGNGGSHCDAMHFAEELTGKFRQERPSFAAIAISDPSYMSCVGNDYGYDYVFSRFIEGLGKKGDVLFCLTTSGNSRNVIEAIKAAKQKGMKTIALTGNDGGLVAGNVDLEIRVNHFGFADRIQEIHIKIIHSIILTVEQTIN
ncbi:MAG: D-sedoheptulose 7-phosphate isomerase [bacterium]|nr:D-sedoheptulose 7-phosphate isomerase [bacterium]